ncbi:MAG: hypothetical protein JRK53_18015, partial [Deltaproteobacteria bacterium]|nr:hypothetical protein [Deltaproteobacteria bacterium]
MGKMKSSVMLIVASAICLVLFAPNAYCQVSGVYGPAAISTGHEEETPTIVLDSAGNAHIVWASGSAMQFLFYKMVDRNGNVVIPETNVNPCTDPDEGHVRRPSIGIDASGQIHIVFHGFSLYINHGSSGYTGQNGLDSSEVIYTKINPAAYLAGGMSDLNDLIVIPETLITPDDDIRSRAPNLVVDAANGRVHIVWFDGGEEEDEPKLVLMRDGARTDVELRYRVLDLNGGEIVPITTLTSGLTIDVDWGEPEIAIDSNGDAHIVYTKDLDGQSWEDEQRDDREVFYTVVAVSGNSAATLINDTMITAEDGHASTRAQLAIDANGMVHVIWQDRRFADNGRAPEIFYCKLNPNPGSGTVGFVITEAQVTPDNDKRSNQKGIAIDSCGRINMAWG